MKKLTFAVVLGAVLATQQIGVGVAQESNGSATIAEANLLYRQGGYLKAVEKYQAAIADGYHNGHVQYNLANAYYRLGEYGHAIASYRRAKELLPTDPDVAANLTLARRKAIDNITEENSAMSELGRLLFLRSLMTEYQLQVIFIVLYTLFWLTFLLIPKGAVPRSKFIRNSLLAAVLFWSLLTFGTRFDRVGKPALALTAETRSLQPAVVVSEEAKVHSGNAESFQVVFVLHMGAEVDSAKQRDSWIEVVLPNKRRGWVQKEHVEIL